MQRILKKATVGDDWSTASYSNPSSSTVQQAKQLDTGTAAQNCRQNLGDSSWYLDESVATAKVPLTTVMCERNETGLVKHRIAARDSFHAIVSISPTRTTLTIPLMGRYT